MQIMRPKIGRAYDDGGFTLTEILVCLPLCIALMTALMTAYGVFCRNYIKIASQWAYVEEIRTITNIVSQRVRCAYDLDVTGSHKLFLQRVDYDGEVTDRLQFYTDPEGKGVFSLNGQPISSSDARQYVNIRDITFEKELPHKVVMHITLENKATGRVDTIENNIYSRLIWLKEKYTKTDGDE